MHIWSYFYFLYLCKKLLLYTHNIILTNAAHPHKAEKHIILLGHAQTSNNQKKLQYPIITQQQHTCCCFFMLIVFCLPRIEKRSFSIFSRLDTNYTRKLRIISSLLCELTRQKFLWELWLLSKHQIYVLQLSTRK